MQGNVYRAVGWRSNQSAQRVSTDQYQVWHYSKVHTLCHSPQVVCDHSVGAGPWPALTQAAPHGFPSQGYMAFCLPSFSLLVALGLSLPGPLDSIAQLKIALGLCPAVWHNWSRSCPAITAAAPSLCFIGHAHKDLGQMSFVLSVLCS